MVQKDYSKSSNLLSRGNADQVAQIKCPDCGGGLRVSYGGSDAAKGIKCECKQCDFIVRICRLKQEPPWVLVLGKEFET